METHYQLTDETFEAQFRERTLNPQLFANHEAHLRLAWIHIKKYGIEQACKNLCTQIQAFDATFGDGTKFHHTLTVASARVVYHFMQKSKASSFQELITKFPRLKTNFKDLLDQHYQTNIFASETAKAHYLEPDLLPFD